MHAGVGLSRNEDLAVAAAEAFGRAVKGVTRPSLLVVVATPEHLDRAIDLCVDLKDMAGTNPRIVGGATSAAAIFGDAEEEEGHVIAVLAFDEGAAPFRLDQPETLREAARKMGPGATALVFADPSAPLNRLLGVLGRDAPGVRIAGGGVAVDGGLLYDDDVYEAGAVGVVVRAERIAVAQSHQPLGAPMLVTQSEGRTLLQLDGKPAVEALESLSELPGMSEDALQFLALGVAPQPGDAFAPEDFVTVPLLGVDDDTGALEAGSPIAEGTSVSFTLRDAMGARRTLSAALQRAGGGTPAWGMYFDCASRGSNLHGMPGLDLRLIEKALGQFPLLAWRTSFELGPAGGGTGVHLFTGVLALGSR